MNAEPSIGENMDKTIVLLVIFIVLIFAVLFGMLGYIQSLKQDCIKTLKDKPAIEIHLVCR